MTRNYELTFIVKPDIDTNNLTTVIDRVKEFITAEGGSIVKLDQWGMRRLMYPIRKYREGQYVFALVQLEASSVLRVESRLRLVEDIIRYLLIRADDITPAPAEEPAAAASAESQPEPAAPEAPAPVAQVTTETAAP